MESFIENVVSGRPARMKTPYVYHGRAKPAMNLVPDVGSIFARCNIEQAKLDGFLELFEDEYGVKEYKAEGDRITITLCRSSGPTKGFMTKLRKREFFVLHVKFNAEDWTQHHETSNTYSTTKTLSTQIERYEGIKVADWIANKTIEFRDGRS